MKTRIVAILSMSMVRALASGANAALPKPSSTLIVPGKSIGGVALGTDVAAAPSRSGGSSSRRVRRGSVPNSSLT